MAFNIADLFEHTADAVPRRIALICGDRTITFAELDRRSNRLAHHLVGVDVGERDPIAIYALNSIEYVETMLAAYKLRAVPINVNYRYEDEELVYLFDNADVVAVAYQAAFAERIASVKDRVPALRHLMEIDDGIRAQSDTGAVRYEEAIAANDDRRDFGPRADGDLYILYTGGTTGMPKGVMWRHEDVWRALGGGIDSADRAVVPPERHRGGERPPATLVCAHAAIVRPSDGTTKGDRHGRERVQGHRVGGNEHRVLGEGSRRGRRPGR